MAVVSTLFRSACFAVGAAMLIAGCSAPAATVPAAEPTASTDAGPTTAPSSAQAFFMVHEAKLPAGFPPPGPIGQVIVKTYPAARVATVLAADVKGKGQDRLFMPLFNHIQQQKISMTAPVVMDFAGNEAANGSAQPSPQPQPQPQPQPPIAMSFLYENESIGHAGKAGIVTVHDVPAITVLSIGVRGSYDGAHFEAGMKAINRWLADHPHQFETAGTPRFLGYNSPFVPWFLRYGEVQVPVRRKSSENQ